METQGGTRTSRAWLYRGLAVLASLGFVSVLVVTSSRAAFVDTTDNPSNTFSAGDVVLDDDDAGSVLFNVANMAPGDSRTRCIAVTYTGSLTADVHLYGTVGGTGLADYLDVDVAVGTGGDFASCTGFSATSTLYTGTLASFGASRTNFANGLGGFNGATDPSTRTYRITVTLQDDNAAQARSATAGFTWEAQNV
ncbi:MAG: hypothetical protein KDB35_01465 [Acidimicrobiales bacterium]|nr:hypothetical protein [Acidimicrobiales bacterium]MCB1014417.1 hypothetical protein [Acidimicrobiales bacterium]MCB9373854.1 hypothetical protein [Microthrixaceae bacterium]